MKKSKFFIFLILLIIVSIDLCSARRGRGRGRTKSRMQLGLPITGKYRDPESDSYYNNHNVSIELKIVKILKNYSTRAPKSPSPHTLIWNIFLGTRSSFCVRLQEIHAQL